ncbi:hypothetical protein FO519_002683 [Halicephalobus sp. NKZ332]|nr:hypothetical protein FO519_002683 [Halicephalobus sp. NKZ332]
MGKQLTAELVNNKIVSLRKVVKIAQRNLTEKIIRQLKVAEESPDERKARKAGRIKEEKEFIAEKRVDADEVAKFALVNTKPLEGLGIQPNTEVRYRVLYKLATEKILVQAVDAIREEYPNWAKEIPFHLQRLGKNRPQKKDESQLQEFLAGSGKKKASADDGPAAKRAKVAEPGSDDESEEEDIEMDGAEDEDDEAEDGEVEDDGAEDDEAEDEAEDEDASDEEVTAPRGGNGTSSNEDDEELPYAQRFAKVQKKKLTPVEELSVKNSKSKGAAQLIDDMAEEEDLDAALFEDAMFGAEDASDEDEVAEEEFEDDDSVESMEVDKSTKKPITAARPLKEVNVQKGGKNVPAKGAQNKGDSTAFVKKVKLDDLARAKEKIPAKKLVQKTQGAKPTAPSKEKGAKKFLAKDSDESEGSDEELPAKKPVQKKGFWKGKDAVDSAGVAVEAEMFEGTSEDAEETLMGSEDAVEEILADSEDVEEETPVDSVDAEEETLVDSEDVDVEILVGSEDATEDSVDVETLADSEDAEEETLADSGDAEEETPVDSADVTEILVGSEDVAEGSVDMALLTKEDSVDVVLPAAASEEAEKTEAEVTCNAVAGSTPTTRRFILAGLRDNSRELARVTLPKVKELSLMIRYYLVYLLLIL